MYLFTPFGDEMKALGDEEFLHQGLREVALVSKERAFEPLDQLGDGASIINVARCQAKSQPFTLSIDAPDAV